MSEVVRCVGQKPNQPEAPASFTRYLRDNSDRVDRKPIWAQRHPQRENSHGLPGYLSEAVVRGGSWDVHKAQADKVATMYASHPAYQNLAVRMASCALSVGFEWKPDRLDKN